MYTFTYICTMYTCKYKVEGYVAISRRPDPRTPSPAARKADQARLALVIAFFTGSNGKTWQVQDIHIYNRYIHIYTYIIYMYIYTNM